MSSPRLLLERMMHRQSVAVPGDSLASYALLTMMMAKVVGLEPGEFVHTLGDAHLYLNHLDQAREQLARDPLPLPRLEIADKADLFSYDYEDFKLRGYKAHEKIAAPIAV